MARIGVFVCWCGSNIAETVDVEKVSQVSAQIPGVVYSVNYKYMCSDPGQDMIKKAIVEYKLTGVVVASCSPRMHEVTFRRAASEAGLNPYMLEMANIREHCSWVHNNKEDATKKAIDLVRMMVEKVKRNQPLTNIKIPVTKKALVIGGGVAGIQAALDIANGGIKTILLDKEPSIGGHMSMLDETFPTLDCSQCILTPKMVEASQNPNIEIVTYSEIEKVSGFVGNFKVSIKKKARYVNPNECTGCGICWSKCPVSVPSEFEQGLGKRKAIYVPFPQAVPNKPVIDVEHCTYFTSGGKRCKICQKVCPKQCINFEDKDEIIEEDIGAIIVATGYDIMPTSEFGEYGYGKYADVVTSLQFERMVCASGPTLGDLQRPSDGKKPETVVFIQCVGSRDPAHYYPYCSKICCMYTAKQTILYRHKVPKGNAYVFYIDIRANGKNYEEFVRRAIEEEEAQYLRGRVSTVYKDGEDLVVEGADTLTNSQVKIKADLVVLATAMVPPKGIKELAQKLGIGYDQYGFLTEAHPKLRPVETSTAGIYLAGACVSPRDIPDSVSEGSGAAAKVLGLLSKDEFEKEGVVAKVNEITCTGCMNCIRICPYKAITLKDIKDRQGNLIKQVAEVNPGLCTGCGTCTPTCPSRSIDLQGFTDEELYSEINALAEL
ncbi:MAG: CoB--CoM heterodisulfide reductase iron-sulfur subunit A family protein [Caldisericia bacterium]|nr:CoB--CoM heterodisulfide reductase iron-sulfur subunit A family protein [Caldisericia bacterium]HOJ16479.1 CoB--CoM heterodisulfide reductase iron-sulfur subunit A family protein [Caldisericia bacterium]HPO28751.1 CoB--CoM heterodisulfide reductase iron-sulfur subunit A family protein [Caldisericia bacterium]